MIKASFVANFEQFYESVNRAVVKLDGLGYTSDQVSARVQRLGASYSGGKLIQDAELTVRAINQIGGASMLTEQETQRLNSQLTAAMEKARRMGVDVSPAMQAMVDATKKATDSTSKLGISITDVGKAIFGAFTLDRVVSGLIGFGQQVLSAGDQIKKMSDQTGLSAEQVQRLQYVAGQSGTEMATMVNAIQNVNQRLGSGDEGTVGAFKRLNINLDEFQRMNAFDQMLTLGDAVGGIKDPTVQAATAADIFGKTWKDLLPALKSGMRDVADQATVMGEETVNRLDAIGDAMSRAKQMAISWGGETVIAIEGMGYAFGQFLSKFNPEHIGQTNDEFIKFAADMQDPDGSIRAMEHARKGAEELMTKGLEPLRKIVPPTAAELKAMDETLKQQAADHKKAEEAAAKQAEALAKYAEVIQLVNVRAGNWAAVTAAMNPVLVEAAKYYFNIGASAGEVAQILGITASQAEAVKKQFYELLPNDAANRFKEISKALNGLVLNDLTSLSNAAREAFDFSKFKGMKINPFRSLGDTLKTELPNQVLQAITSGGNVIQTAGSTIGKWLTSDQGFGKQISSGFTKVLGDGLGGALSTVLPGIGALAGPLLSTGISAIGRFFGSVKNGADDSMKKIKDLSGQFESLTKDVTDLAKQTEPSFSDMQKVVQDFGLDLSKLGPVFQQQEMDLTAKGIIDAFATMQRGGADVNGVLVGMSDEVSTFVQKSLALGTTVPANMQPMLQAMVNAGLITDDNGKKLDSLKDIKFGDPIRDKFDVVKAALDEVMKKIDDLAIKLTTDLVGAAELAARGMSNIGSEGTRTPNRYQNPEAPSQSEQYALGTINSGSYFRNFGSGTSATLHGSEAVIRRDQAVGFAQAVLGDRLGSATVEELRAMRSDLNALPYHLSRAVRDAVLLA